MDEDNDDGLGGRSRDRREVTEANRWSGPLCALSAVDLAGAPLTDELRAAVELGISIGSHRARQRQLKYIDKLVRDLDDEAIAAIDAFLADPGAGRAALEAWVDRFVSEGDEAISAWIELHPEADRQRLRNLARNARAGSGRAALRSALGAFAR